MSNLQLNIRKAFVTCIFLLAALPVVCQAGFFAEAKKTERISNPTELTVIVPYNKEVDSSRFSIFDFNGKKWGHPPRQERITTFDKTSEDFKVDRRTDNGTSGSGKIYTVNYIIEKRDKASLYKFKASSFTTYQEGLIMPFPVPGYTEQDLMEYIATQPLYLSLEIKSQYNTESIYANFMRLAEKAPIYPGEKDPVTGKVYKDKFVLNCKYGKLIFSLETYPYHNGSKAVIGMLVPGTFTSRNTVDFAEMLKK